MADQWCVLYTLMCVPKVCFNFFLSGTPYPYQPTQYVPPRYIRNPLPTGDAPYQDPYPAYAPERQYPPPHHSGPTFSGVSAHPYPPPSHYDARRHGPYAAPPPPPQPFGPPRDELVRMSPVSLDVPPTPGAPTSIYHPEAASRERYPPEGYYPPAPHPGQIRSHIRVSSFLFTDSEHL